MKRIIPLLVAAFVLLTLPARISADASTSQLAGMEMQRVGRPWSEVFSWFADEFEVPIVTSFKPCGSFAFSHLKGRGYSMYQVIGIMNVAMRRQGCVLVECRGASAFALHALDEEDE